VKTLFRGKNLGCHAAVRGALDWFFSHVKEGIILEDDCVPDPSFFPYCSELLERYRTNRSILTIGGSNMGQVPADSSYGFTPFMNMWGWASWADRAIKIDYEQTSWGKPGNRLKLFISMQRGRPCWWHLDYRWFLHWCKSFGECATGMIQIWDICWVYHGIMHQKVSIFPSVNMIQNIGFGIGATHTVSESSPLANLKTQSISFPLNHPNKIKFSKAYELDGVRRKWSSFEPSFIQDLRTIYFYTKMAWLKRRNPKA
jgi:hypothetical protein